MITIAGIYDGIHVVPVEQVPTRAISKVHITFLDEAMENEDASLHHLAASLNFNFWGNEREESDSLSEK